MFSAAAIVKFPTLYIRDSPCLTSSNGCVGPAPSLNYILKKIIGTYETFQISKILAPTEDRLPDCVFNEEQWST